MLRHYTQALYSGSILRHYTQALYLGIILRQYTQAVYSGIIPRHYTQELYSGIIPKYYRTCPNMLKMYELINAGNSNGLKNLSIFINKAFELRNNTLYADNRN